MFKCFSIGVLVVALLPVGGGVAAAYPTVANVDQSKDVDGWHLSLRITDITIESVPNIAATPTSREGFVTATVTEEITRINPGEPSAENTILTAAHRIQGGDGLPVDWTEYDHKSQRLPCRSHRQHHLDPRVSNPAFNRCRRTNKW